MLHLCWKDRFCKRWAVLTQRHEFIIQEADACILSQGMKTGGLCVSRCIKSHQVNECWTTAAWFGQRILWCYAVVHKTQKHLMDDGMQRTSKQKDLPGCEGMLVPSATTSSPCTSFLYRLMTCVKLSLASKISAVRRRLISKLFHFPPVFCWNIFCNVCFIEKWRDQRAYPRLHHYPLYH